MARLARAISVHIVENSGTTELIYGEPASARDPARFSFAHGGKDGHPYPVDRATYDRTISVLGETVNRAKIAHSEKRKALAALARFGA